MAAEDAFVGRPKKISRYNLEPTASSLTSVREFIRTTLKPFKPVEPIVHDIVSATHEATKNAVVHNPQTDAPIEVVCKVMEDAVVIEVNDRGSGFNHEAQLPPELPDPESMEGRGMFMIYMLMDEVETRTGTSGTRVTMLKRFDSDPS
ncbi:MAG TPA: ATP-binding protein [Candidatus Anoxymicrobiaceae bacterium]|jgi:anti-sigma regulatory factor (Ser/Thr protein kinase)